jgi:hypothetical protein
MTQFRTISECSQAPSPNQPGHSIGKPEGPPATTYNIAVRFANPLPETVTIRRRVRLVLPTRSVSAAWPVHPPTSTPGNL